MSEWAITKSVTLILKHPVPVWLPEMGPPNLPDYGIWPVISEAVYKTRAASVPIKMQEASDFKFRNADPEKIRKICQKKSTKIGGMGCQKWHWPLS